MGFELLPVWGASSTGRHPTSAKTFCGRFKKSLSTAGNLGRNCVFEHLNTQKRSLVLLAILKSETARLRERAVPVVEEF